MKQINTNKKIENALLIVDLQNDFLDGGALGIKDSKNIIEPLNNFLKQINQRWLIVASKDHHPKNHCSFTTWPIHCVKNTNGSQIHELSVKPRIIFKKGTKKQADSYSAFFNSQEKQTKLNKILKKHEIKNLYVCGLAFDYCVIASAIDGAKNGYNTYIIKDFTASVDVKNEKDVINKSKENNIKIINSKDLNVQTVN